MLFKNFLRRRIKINKETFVSNEDKQNDVEKDKTMFFLKLQKNVDYINDNLKNSLDVKNRFIKFGTNSKYEICLIYIDGITDTKILSDNIIQPLSKCKIREVKSKIKLLDKIEQEILWSSECKIIDDINDAISCCLKGESILLLDGCKKGLILNTKGGEKRSISEPQSESVVRGPREGFTENSRTNTSLIRRKIRNTDLVIEDFTVGEKTQTQISILYLQHVARPDIVNTVRMRIKNLNVESILESGYIEQYIEDQPFSLYPTVDYTEKPDVVAGKILEGRVAIVIDGTPFVLTVPMLFIESFQTAEDYYHRPIYSSFIRIVRFVAYFISVFTPAIYIALTNFHQELIPTRLLLSIIKAKEGTPFPIFFETLIMVLAFEFLREAGIRLPRSVGQAISIVGALVMGEAAVSAGIVGAPVVIVIAITAVCSFLLPTQNNSSTVIRFLMMLCASMFGWFGISMGFFALLIYLATIQSFGVPYFDSLSNIYDLKDTFFRFPLWANNKRPVNLAYLDKSRIDSDKIITSRKDVKKNKDK